MKYILIVDGANVVGATPNGWWHDRAKAAAKLHQKLILADISYDEIVLVLEGQAKAGMRPGKDLHLRTVHASKDGDQAIVDAAQKAIDAGNSAVVITADRLLRQRVEFVGARTMSPSWLLDLLQ